jgi:Peptidase family U32
MRFGELERLLGNAGLRLAARPAESAQRFADGLRYRIEIPSVEGPAVLTAVLEQAERSSVPVRRVSQGSGVMMLTDDEIREMARLGADVGVEVSLFLGPRGAWDTGGQAFATAAAGGVARGLDAVAWCVAEARRACELGIRSLLVADLGVLGVLGELRAAGELPANLLLKTSVLLPAANPATARTLERLGAGTINVATDLSPAQLAELRESVTLPLDVYVEVPDDQGGFVRFYEVPDVIRAAAPVYVKLGLRNAPAIYPSGLHLADTAEKLGRERVRRAELCLRLLGELAPELLEDAGAPRPPDLAIPEV